MSHIQKYLWSEEMYVSYMLLATLFIYITFYSFTIKQASSIIFNYKI